MNLLWWLTIFAGGEGVVATPTAVRVERFDSYRSDDVALSVREAERLETIAPTGRTFLSWSET